MARVKLSPLLTSISGSIGALTIQRNKYGISARQKPLPKRLLSPAQYIVRQHMITIQAAWQALSDDDRLQWNRFPDFSGQTINRDKSIKLSGHALYLKYQMFRLIAGFPLLTVITYHTMPTPAVLYGLSLDVADFLIDVGPEQDPTESFFLFSISMPKREGTAPSQQGLRYMYVVPAINTYFDITESYKAAFGNVPLVESWFNYSIRTFSTLSPIYSGITYGKMIYEIA